MILVDTPMHGWSHMTSDKIEELHAFARALGIKKCWYEYNNGRPHYDIKEETILKAERFGAKKVDRKTLLMFIKENHS